MHFGLVLKTYRGDYAYAKRLLESFHKYNVDSLSLIVVVPREDINFFAEVVCETVILIADSEIPVQQFQVGDLPRRFRSNRDSAPEVGYLNQRILKLGFHRLQIFDAFLVVDSDTEFVRPIRRSDYIGDSERPIVSRRPLSDLQRDAFYWQRYGAHLQGELASLQQLLVPQRPYADVNFCNQVISAAAMSRFENEFLNPRGLDFRGIIALSEYEMLWYLRWCETHCLDLVEFGGERTLTIHHQGQHLNLVNYSTGFVEIPPEYAAVIVNSNWSRQYGVVGFDSPPLLRYLSEGAYAEWLRLRA